MTLAEHETHQPTNALAKGNEVRLGAAAFLRRLRDSGGNGAQRDAPGRDLAREVLEDPSVGIGTIPLHRFLTAIPGFGQARVTATLTHCGIVNGARRICDLTAGERNRLRVALDLPFPTLKRSVCLPSQLEAEALQEALTSVVDRLEAEGMPRHRAWQYAHVSVEASFAAIKRQARR